MKTMNRELAFFTGLGVGAGIMYFLDPEVGRRRRALCRDQFIRAGHEIEACADKAWKDLQNRAQGIAAETSAALVGSREEASDQVVHDRIRAKIGHHLSHPKSIEVDVSAGQVMLRGAIMASEVSCLLSCVRGVPGVRKIEHQLDIYDRPDNQPELQGGRRSGQNALPAFSPSTRLLLGSAGLGLLVFGPAQSFPLACALGMGGLALLAGSATGSQRSWPFLPEMQREGAGRGASRREAPVKKDIRQFEPVEAAV